MTGKQAPRAQYHGQDRDVAVKRVKEIRGLCIYSWSPRDRGEWGYWSEPGDGCLFLRSGEYQEWPKEAA